VNKLGKNVLLRCNVSAILTKVVIQMDFYTIRKDGVGNWQKINQGRCLVYLRAVS
jgi:hypothetical protein